MKLANDALIRIIEILRQGLMEEKDVSELLRELDLEQDSSGCLRVSSSHNEWKATIPETD